MYVEYTDINLYSPTFYFIRSVFLVNVNIFTHNFKSGFLYYHKAFYSILCTLFGEYCTSVFHTSSNFAVLLKTNKSINC